MTWLDLAKKHGRQWVNDVLDLICQLEDRGIDPGQVLIDAMRKAPTDQSQ